MRFSIVRRRWLPAGGAFVAVATLAVALPAGSVAHRAAAATAPCRTAGLVVWSESGGAAAGSFFYHLRFTNLAGAPCTLQGRPGVSAVDLAGHRLGAAARPESGPAHLITLARGATASAVLRITDTGVLTPSACRPVTAAGLRVYPPNQSAAKYVPFPFSACSRSPTVFMSLRAVTH